MDKKYSDWLKIDLHIHTDWSRKTKENDYKGNFSVANLKQKLLDNGVQLFSLTDHNIINIDAYKEYYESFNLNTDPLLLIGVELDIVVNNTQSEKTYHSLLIFNNPSIEYATELSQSIASLMFFGIRMPYLWVRAQYFDFTFCKIRFCFRRV